MFTSKKNLTAAFCFMSIVAGFLSVTPIDISMAAQTPEIKWPERDIVIIVPFRPGGGYDIKARLLAPFLTKYLPRKVNIIIKNVPGAEAKIGTLEMANSKPDGYTLGLVDPLQLGVMEKQGGFGSVNPRKFSYVGQIDATSSLMVVKTDGRFKTIDDMRGQNVSFGVVGSNALLNIAVVNALGAKPTYIAYDNTPDGCMAVARGDLDVWMTTATTVYKQTETLQGKIKPLILVGGRHPMLPASIKTASEAGLIMDEAPGLNRVIVAGPANLSPVAHKVLEEAMVKASKDPDYVEKMKKVEYIPEPVIGPELQKQVDAVYAVIDKYASWIPKQ